MKKNHKKLFNRPLTIAASLAVCICLTGISAMAASGKLQGFFKEKTNWQGAVTGTVYEQATDEISISVLDLSDENAATENISDGKLEILVQLENATKTPYREFDLFGVEAYEILDTNGNVVSEGATERETIVNGLVKVIIPVESLPTGEYRLVIEAFVGEKKADQPLVLKGSWECGFVR